MLWETFLCYFFTSQDDYLLTYLHTYIHYSLDVEYVPFLWVAYGCMCASVTCSLKHGPWDFLRSFIVCYPCLLLYVHHACMHTFTIAHLHSFLIKCAWPWPMQYSGFIYGCSNYFVHKCFFCQITACAFVS